MLHKKSIYFQQICEIMQTTKWWKNKNQNRLVPYPCYYIIYIAANK